MEKNKKQYTVKDLARLAGVTVRTLHVYDKMGLLLPAVRTEKNYRLYGEGELLQLQQILFYKEIGFSLNDILDILSDPDFDLVDALGHHKQALQSRMESIAEMLRTIDTTILKLKGELTMTHEDLYAGLPREQAVQWQKEAKERWPQQVAHSEEMLLRMSKRRYDQLQKDFMENWGKLLSMYRQAPESEQVQKEIGNHYRFILQFWGQPNVPKEAYIGLGELYVADQRYVTINGEANPEAALFLLKAIRHYAARNL